MHALMVVVTGLLSQQLENRHLDNELLTHLAAAHQAFLQDEQVYKSPGCCSHALPQSAANLGHPAVEPLHHAHNAVCGAVAVCAHGLDAGVQLLQYIASLLRQCQLHCEVP